MAKSNALGDERAADMHNGYASWKQDLQHYETTKKNFQGVPEPYKKVTSAFVKGQEVLYNPITQTYSDPQREAQTKQLEKQNMIDVLAQNKVSGPTDFPPDLLAD